MPAQGDCDVVDQNRLSRLVTFASADIEVARPFGELEAVLRESPPTWLAALIEEAGKDSSELLDTVGPVGSGYRFPILEEVKVHPALQVDGGLVVPLEWGSAAPDAIFRVGEADLLVIPAEEPTRAQIDLRVRVSAATDGPGIGPDLVVLEATQAYTRRVAELIVAHLLDRVAA